MSGGATGFIGVKGLDSETQTARTRDTIAGTRAGYVHHAQRGC
jgi:hypothetical protein